ncbi:janus kinase and microtubule-interacting protein 2-like isoform X2 [Leptopilina heterotoma]|uniref:janus kinase and microtubule-interacting protein 2-like isoform X2 n=1 Tax=Leptopilina heterotoma TaxID=63436 RepID=UPI001CA9788A|nr:janus kinase and microtubule-interacting protein 2-like isoform X2 [Leptopilina heterotoma]
MPTDQLSTSCKIEETMNSSAGDTVIATNTSSETTGDPLTLTDDNRRNQERTESKSVTRKRRQIDPPSSKMEIPRKTPRHEDLSANSRRIHFNDADEIQRRSLKRPLSASINSLCKELKNKIIKNRKEKQENNDSATHDNDNETENENCDELLNSNTENSKNDHFEKEPLPNSGSDVTPAVSSDGILGEDETNKKEDVALNLSKDKAVSGLHRKPPDAGSKLCCKRKTEKVDDVTRLRKTIQWLEEGARRMREDLAAVRSELHEERKAAKLVRRDLETAIRDARVTEAAKNQQIISDLKVRLSQSPSRSVTEATLVSSKVEFLKDENHRRELSALKKRLVEAETTIKKLKTNSLTTGVSMKRRKIDSNSSIDLHKLEIEVQSLRAANKKLEEKLQIATEAEKSRTAELRVQHENHEAEQAGLQKIFRTETIKMMDEIRSKSREIEKLKNLVRKLRSREDETMRKLRESERNHHIRLTPRIEEKIPNGEHAVDLCKRECEAVAEVERLRELAVEQQEAIEVLRQAVKEKERKLDQLSNKKRKEEFYKQWLELEPVAEVDDEEENEGDSALSSAPSSLSPQPGGCGQWQANGVTREAYESLLFEVEELQTKLLEEQRELVHAKSQVRDLEKALLQETRGSQNSKRALSDKLRDAEERESNLIAEISELREQNELLEFRILEMEETPNQRDTPDPADSGIVSPEPIHLYKEQSNKPKDRAVATVIPYTSTLTQPVSPVPQKPPLSLQESGIFEEDDSNIEVVEVTNCGTQTEAPAGELLQEVQRLQELRARIQERAVKVPVSPVNDTKTCSTPEVTETVDIAQIAIYQERIHDLESRLQNYEEAEEKFLHEQQISKQRDEELLDENYKLTEKIYWLENEMRNMSVAPSANNHQETMTDLKIGVDFSSQWNGEEMENSPSAAKECCLECCKLLKNFESRIEQLGQTEYILRQQITVLEHRERAFIETLKQADTTWSSVEMDYKKKYEEMQERLQAQTQLNRVFLEHLSALNKISPGVSSTETEYIEKLVGRLSGALDSMDVTDGIEAIIEEKKSACQISSTEKVSSVFSSTSNAVRDNLSPRPWNAKSTEAMKQVPRTIVETKGAVSQVTLASDEDHEDQSEAQITIDETDPDKKQVIYFRWR